jgi:hypothetical protein
LGGPAEKLVNRKGLCAHASSSGQAKKFRALYSDDGIFSKNTVFRFLPRLKTRGQLLASNSPAKTAAGAAARAPAAKKAKVALWRLTKRSHLLASHSSTRTVAASA